jgi:rhomboid family GlyGly-CTERM serine protease
LFVLPAILIAALDPLADALVLTRTGIGAGEVWRLWTGHWVHFSGSHLGWNLGVMVLAGVGLESRRPGSLSRYTVIVAPLISVSLLIGQPAMSRFGGLSGLATGVVVLLGLALMDNAGRDRRLGLGLLLLVAVKLGHDLLEPAALFSRFATPGIRPLALAHLVGAGLAVFFAGISLLGTALFPTFVHDHKNARRLTQRGRSG